MREDAARYVIAMCGEGGVGKTSLLKCLEEQLDIEVVNRQESLALSYLQGPPFRQFFSVDCERIDVALVVYDVTRPNTFFAVNEYLEELDRLCSELGVIIVANKTDMDTRVVPTEAGRMLAQTWKTQYVEVASTTHEGVQPLVRNILDS